MRINIIIILLICTLIGNVSAVSDFDRYVDGLKSDRLSVKKEAVIMLGNLDKKEAVPLLIELLENDKNEMVHRLSVAALGKLNDERAVPVLISVLKNSKGIAIKRDIIGALSAFNSGEVIAALAGLLNSPSPLMRRHTVLALGKIGDASVEQDIIGCLGDMSSDVRIACIDYLSGIKSRAAVPLIAGLLLSDRVENVRIAAVEALGSIGGGPAKKALVKGLKGKDLIVSCYSAGALGMLGKKGGLKRVLKASSASDIRVRIAAARALGKIRHRKAVKALKKLMDDENEKVRKAAGAAIKKNKK